jgi:hypothetical protein
MSNQQELQELWRALFLMEPPAPQQWVIWENIHGEGIVKKGLLALAVKHRKMASIMTQDHMIRFMSAVCNRLTSERNAAISKLKTTAPVAEQIAASVANGAAFLGRTARTVVITTDTETGDDNRGNKI